MTLSLGQFCTKPRSCCFVPRTPDGDAARGEPGGGQSPRWRRASRSTGRRGSRSQTGMRDAGRTAPPRDASNGRVRAGTGGAGGGRDRRRSHLQLLVGSAARGGALRAVRAGRPLLRPTGRVPRRCSASLPAGPDRQPSTQRAPTRTRTPAGRRGALATPVGTPGLQRVSDRESRSPGRCTTGVSTPPAPGLLTSVGAGAIRRWIRPLTFQDAPAELAARRARRRSSAPAPAPSRRSPDRDRARRRLGPLPGLDGVLVDVVQGGHRHSPAGG